MSVIWIEICQRILTPSVSSVIQPCPSTFYDLTVHCGSVNRTFPLPKVVRKPFMSWLVVEQVASCMNTSIHEFAGDTSGKRQSVSCCTKTQLQTVFYFIFCSWCYSWYRYALGTINSIWTLFWCSSSHFTYNKSMVICILSKTIYCIR
jgi:hypothetical protein